MRPMSYAQQVQDHIEFLRSQGLEVETLQIDTGQFVRCHKLGVTGGEKAFAYKCQSQELENGLFGLGSWCRGVNGPSNHQTSGDGSTGADVLSVQHAIKEAKLDSSKDLERYEAAARKAYGFWIHSSETGESDYLKRKGVGSYGIRFRSSEQYGNVAVVPMFDIEGRLWNRQLLNADGTKLMATDGRTSGLFHALRKIEPGQPFGIAESYATAATCMELINIPVVCAFSGWNLKEAALALAQKYLTSRIIIFADNDRHLSSNKGIEYAQAAVDAIGERATLLAPDFGDRQLSKNETDWNDLARIFGREFVKIQLRISLGTRAQFTRESSGIQGK